MPHILKGSGTPARAEARRAAMALCAASLGVAGAACATDPLSPAPRSAPLASATVAGAPDITVLRWSGAELAAIRATNFGPPRISRGLAVPTRPGARQPDDLRTDANKRRAVSFAAYRALVDLYPTERAAFDGVMAELGYDPAGAAAAPDPASVGTAAAEAVLDDRRHDGANQMGDEPHTSAGPFSDYTGYAPVNTPDRVTDRTRWQPLRGNGTEQRFLAPHWGRVRPFALADGSQFRPPPPRASAQNGAYVRQVEETLHASARLADEEKSIAEYWSDGPRSETPPGHWCLFARWVAERDRLGLDDQVRLFFALGNAAMDAGIAAWDAKRFYDTVRPITAVRVLKAGKPVRAWGGPGSGTVLMRGEDWMPYQAATLVTPPFPEYVSGHSTFSAAAATVLARFTGGDAFGYSVVLPPNSSRVESGSTPARAVTLSWPTFTAAADQAGMSRRYGGIHFEEGDLAGRVLGRRVGALVWKRAAEYWTGEAGRAAAVATR